MAVGLTLGQVLAKACHEAGISAQSALNQDVREAMKSFIVDAQELVLDEYDWDELKGGLTNHWFDLTLVAGERYYNWPTGMDWETVTAMWTQLGSVWVPMEKGIAPADYSAFNSDDDVRTFPPRKWEFHTATQVEIWPIPSDVGAIRIAAMRDIAVPVSESAVMTFDSIALAKFAAASYLRSKPDETGEARRIAATRYAEGDNRVKTLRARRGKMKTKMNFSRAGPAPDPMDPRFRILVAT